MTQAHIFYSGTVQGVGFRYTVQRHAVSLGLLGLVRNLRDGRVEVLVEGKKEDIEELMRQVEGHFSDYIQDKQVSFEASQGQMRDFRIA
jgi:acylphosphatase